MININISVKKVDYEAALETLLPVLLEHLSKKSDNTFLTGILSKTKSISVVAVKGALRALPQETRDELAVVCMRRFLRNISTEICIMGERIMELNSLLF